MRERSISSWVRDKLIQRAKLDDVVPLILDCSPDAWWSVRHLETELYEVRNDGKHIPRSGLWRILGRLRNNGHILIKGTKVALLARLAEDVGREAAE